MATQIRSCLQKLKGFYQSLVRKTKAVTCVKEKEKKMRDEVKEDNLKNRSSSANDLVSLGTESIVAYGGVVHKLRAKETGIIMAAKVEKKDDLSATTKREIEILESLGRHPSIVGFMGATIVGDDVIVTMEYVETDLRSYVTDLERKQVFTINEVKQLMKQLLEGVVFLHGNGVMHGDLKPDNILINKGGGDLKICNFGMATRVGEVKRAYLPDVGSTRWYRVPELLSGVKEYSSEVDMWNVGCIMEEMVLVLLNKICRHLGQSEDSSLMSYAKYLLKEEGLDLLRGLLSEDPSERITTEYALNHVWFHETA